MNWDAIILALIAAVPSTLVALSARRQAQLAKDAAIVVQPKLESIEVKVDGKMSELVELTRKLAIAQATLAEKAAESDRQGAAATAALASAVPINPRQAIIEPEPLKVK